MKSQVIFLLLAIGVVADSQTNQDDAASNRNLRGRGQGGCGGHMMGGGGGGHMMGGWGGGHMQGGWGGGLMQGGGGHMQGGGGGCPCPEMQVIHKLLDNREKITRTHQPLDSGMKSWTHSTDDQVNGWIQQHVNDMMALVHDGRRIREWDAFFREMFDSDVHLDCHSYSNTGGANCTLVSPNHNDACAIGLAQKHAEIVDEFLSRGYDAVHEDHEDDIPDSCLVHSS